MSSPARRSPEPHLSPSNSKGALSIDRSTLKGYRPLSGSGNRMETIQLSHPRLCDDEPCRLIGGSRKQGVRRKATMSTKCSSGAVPGGETSLQETKLLYHRPLIRLAFGQPPSPQGEGFVGEGPSSAPGGGLKKGGELPRRLKARNGSASAAPGRFPGTPTRPGWDHRPGRCPCRGTGAG